VPKKTCSPLILEVSLIDSWTPSLGFKKKEREGFFFPTKRASNLEDYNPKPANEVPSQFPSLKPLLKCLEAIGPHTSSFA